MSGSRCCPSPMSMAASPARRTRGTSETGPPTSTILDGQQGGSVVTVAGRLPGQHDRRLHDPQRQGSHRRRDLLLLRLPDDREQHDHGKHRATPAAGSTATASSPTIANNTITGNIACYWRRDLLLLLLPDDREQHDHGKHRISSRRRDLLLLLPPRRSRTTRSRATAQPRRRRDLLLLFLPDDREHDRRLQLLGYLQDRFGHA